jgi:hypothetical protein
MATNIYPNGINQSGHVLTSLTGTGVNWVGASNSMSASKFTNSEGKEVFSLPADEPTLDIKGRVRMNDEYLDERLERIETLLQIPTRDVTMENKYPKLKELYDAYILELEKLKTWDRIKGGENE